jgi:hypothetical protein
VPPTARQLAAGPCTGADVEGSGGMGRYDVLRRIERLDPARDFAEIYRLMGAYEFPWDMTQALSFALFRTYAVPSIGALLARTGELTARPQKRYDDTVLILDAVIEYGMDSPEGRTAIRRMNQMHGAHAIGNDDLRYVLATFVVTPIRWVDAYGWRRMTEVERIASANYYRALGRRMGIRGIPVTWQAFARLLDTYEREHFGFDPGARTVAEATLALFATFPPNHFLPQSLARRMSLAAMDPPLLDAFDIRRPGRVLRRVVRTGLRTRGRVVRFLPPRREPFSARQLPQVRSYPDGYDVADLGTFAPGCPVPRPRGSAGQKASASSE